MILRCSVRDATTGEHHALEVVLEGGSTMASLLAASPVRVGRRPCYVGQELLSPTATFAECPLVAGAVISVGAPGPDPRSTLGEALGALRVVAGPDSGAFAWLGPGTHAMGAGESVALQLKDESLAGRQAQLEVGSSGVTLQDLSPVGQPARPQGKRRAPITLKPGVVLEAGGDRLEWVPKPGEGLVSTRSADGRVDFNRAFAPSPSTRRLDIALPTPVGRARNVGALIATGLAPVVMGGVVAAATRQVEMLLFALLGPVTALVTHVVERRQRTRQQKAFEAEKKAVLARISAAVRTEERLLRTLAPDQVDLTLAGTGVGPGLWPRTSSSPTGLVVRVGTADVEASIDLRGEAWPGLKKPILRDVPMTVDLRSTGVFGLVGPREPLQALLRWVLVQLAVLRGPDDLRLVMITSSDSSELSWAGWLPHLDAGEGAPFPCWIGNTSETRAARVAELKDLIRNRLDQQRTAGSFRFDQEVVLVLDGAPALRNLPGMADILRDGPRVGVYVICADEHTAPNECRGVARLSSSSINLQRRKEDQPIPGRPDRMERAAAGRLARCLSPMRDRLVLGGAETAVPFPVRFLDLFGIRVPASSDVLARWAEQPGPSTNILVGADGSGSVSVDLALQGPHTMLGGATGAGKSILLQTVVTSILLANRPDELNLVLVDFKGGSAFLPFEHCPQVVGLIRSTGETPADVFDEAAATRVLASVRAEVRRRESALARYGGEIDEYWKARRRTPSLSALPRLVMIFDEFARVLEVSPNFLKELVNVAAKGRSLGMHLVLATQSLQGKLSPELKNNIELRITLRQNEDADSVEVLGVPDAATIPGRLRGRGMILSTKDENRVPGVFQSGYLGNPPPVGGAPPARARILDWFAFGAPRPDEPVNHGDAKTDLALAVEAIEEAARQLGVVAPHRPLLPPLPAELALEDLPAVATGAVPSSAVPFGLIDNPVAQEQPAAFLDLAATDRWLIAGGPESGRSTLVRSLVTSLVTRFPPDQAHLYLLEHQPGGLAAYADLPHCGGVFAAGEPERVRRLVTWLDGEVQRRRLEKLSGTYGHSPWIVVVIDGWEQFENRSDPTFVETSILTTLRGLVTAGSAVGVHVVALGGQDMMAGKLPALFSRRLLLPFPKEETRRAHLASGVVSPPVLAGRAVDASEGLQVQVAQPRSTPAELLATHAAHGASSARLPHRFPPMPVRIALHELEVPDPPPSSLWVPIGLGGPKLATVGVDLFDAGPHLMLVSGPSGSGRTTAVATLAHSLRRSAIGVLAISSLRSPLADLLPDDEGVQLLRGLTFKDAALREAADTFGGGPYAVLVDDCEQITVTPTQEGFSEAPTLLHDIVRPDAFGRQALILAGDALPILYGQRRSLMRIVEEVKLSGTRLLLSPSSPPSAREHGFTLEADQFFAGPPGRAYLGAGRSSSLVQLAVLSR